LRNADGAFIVYDITNESSFDAIDYWYEQIKLSSNDDIIIYLLGNKIDLNNNRIISRNSGLDKAKKMGMDKFAEVSAKTKENLMEKLYYNNIYFEIKIGTPEQRIPMFIRMREYSSFITSKNLMVQFQS